MATTNTSQSRNSNIELLRFLLMFGICFWHMLVHGVGLKGMAEEQAVPTHEEIILMGILVPCTNTFMLISGYYGIKLSRKKLMSLSLQGMIYFLLTEPMNLVLGGGNSSRLLTHIPPISTRVWWFLTFYTVIMILSPIINKGIEQIDKQKFGRILIALIFIESYGLYINMSSLGSDLLGLLNIYLIGRYLRQNDIVPSIKKSMLMWLVSTAALILLMYIATSTGHLKKTWMLVGYNNPLVIIQAIAILMLFLRFKSRSSKLSLFLGCHSLAIYLVTEQCGWKLYPLWAGTYSQSICHVTIFISITCFSIVLLDILQQKFNVWLCNMSISK